MPVEPGLTGHVELVVTDDDTAIAARSGDVAVLSTPRVVALCEEAAIAAIGKRLAKGETISHMAQGMNLSVKTVSTYRTRVMEKMGLESNSDLTYYALKNGLIQ